MDNRRVWLVVGAVILGLALLGGVMAGAGAPEEAWGVFFVPAGLTIFNPIFWVILLIVLAARRNRQQQQQQVVVVAGAPPAETGGQRLRCAKCQGLSRIDARFCGNCGVALA